VPFVEEEPLAVLSVDVDLLLKKPLELARPLVSRVGEPPLLLDELSVRKDALLRRRRSLKKAGMVVYRAIGW